MKFTVITLFPELIDAFLSSGLLGQARDKGVVSVATLNPREFTEDVHQTVDDRVFGGGDGMVMKVEPLARAVASIDPDRRHVSVLTPQGRRWMQDDARTWAQSGKHQVLVCGRYAGIDQRFSVLHAQDEISLGDFILNGGEVAACALIESVTRLLPGALGNRTSALRDSFDGERLECPQFTRPREVGGLPVPAPLLSGNHAKIAEFEGAVALVRTLRLRPELVRKPIDIEASLRLLGDLAEPELRSLGLCAADLEQVRGAYRAR